MLWFRTSTASDDLVPSVSTIAEGHDWCYSARHWKSDWVTLSESSGLDSLSHLLSAGRAHVFPGSLDAACMRPGSGRVAWISTLHVVSISEMAFRLRLAVAITSSCWAEFPAATALAVAMVMPFVMRVNTSGVVDLSGTSLDLNTWRDDEPQTQVGSRHGRSSDM